MIDFHTHLDLYRDAKNIAKKTSDLNHFTLAVTTSPKAWMATTKILGHLPNIHIALGLHPEIVAQKVSERELMLQLIAKAPYIGEVGLDGSPKHKSNFHLQVSILDSVLNECSTYGGRIISLHSRRAVNHVLDLLDKYPDSGTPVLHWFSGSKLELSRAIKRGCWFSFGPAGLSTPAGKDILKAIPLERLLPESDGPFAQVNGAEIMPWQASGISSDVSFCKGISAAAVEEQFSANLRNILKIHNLC